MDTFDNYFLYVTGFRPHGWQADLATETILSNRIVRIPTGFGKTLGILVAWLWHRIQQQDDRWPRRLVWCLPMRVLVEQTESEVRSTLETLGLLWNGGEHAGKVGVHVLMGGIDSGNWHLYPEHCAVLIGTQDMLLSRALNRGYASPRARWPMEFGLLNHDALWVMDEVQLMDVGLATSAQVQAFRDDDAADQSCIMRPCHTWWMSATLQKNWLEKSPDTERLIKNLSLPVKIPERVRVGHLWDDVDKPCRMEVVKDAKGIAALVAREHISVDRSQSGPTLVVLNRVATAVEVYKLLAADNSLKQTDIRLVHSRFRPSERAAWRNEFLNKNACASGTDRIIVATQVVEAGVDISASLLITELAPWASLVQRFGRSARWGGTAQVIVVDLLAGQAREALRKAREAKEKKKEIDESAIIDTAEARTALPYSLDELRAGREALGLINNVSPKQLESFEEGHIELLSRLYPFEPAHLLLRHELDELFDTTTDLSGADIDISRFIRSGNERDLQVFWAEIAEKTEPTEEARPTREALCSVPFLTAREWLCGSGARLEKGKRAWVWDWLEGSWRRAESRDLYPGQTVLVAADCGGYHVTRGWDPKSTASVQPVEAIAVGAAEKADATQDNEALSIAQWQTIAFHGKQVAQLLCDMALQLIPRFAKLFDLSGRVHDVGKSHLVFQQRICRDGRPDRSDLAKAPEHSWSKKNRRRGFRHELASALALLWVLRRHNPDHPALLGPWRNFLDAAGIPPLETPKSESPPTLIEEEILSLSADHFNLLIYLVCAHHGKVRLAWHACPADQESLDDTLRICGIRDGEMLPSLPLYTANGGTAFLPETFLDLVTASAGLNPKTGQGWTERVLSLLSLYGPFGLAWFEAIIRAADQRVSMTAAIDLLLKEEVV